ncbi:MAG: hypothetical protein I3273_03030 [Candidatus Moeniiplasma glomeromycotorum]|nr:hypothetical protein [Candidatus Moeniiplasma glomeromycotorum]MCE8167568.1 hypothetical protein [Candidatus Moeniiplasma glomeromycotorum]MCE8169080.1 hypothetical protein [Candidatus Moeniiplasma glomeromycotorum]
MPITQEKFKNLGQSRKGWKKYAGDAGYWNGGQCNWGSCHTLKIKDCQTLAGSLNKMRNLKRTKKHISESEYGNTLTIKGDKANVKNVKL